MGDKKRTKTLLGDQLFPQGKEIHTEITPQINRRKTLQSLKENETFFKAITQNSTDIIIIVNRRGRISYVNPTVEGTLGYVPEELIGRSAFDFISKKDLPRACLDFAKAILTKNITIPNAFEVMHKDGSIHILEGVGKNMFGNPSVKGFVMNVRDITQRIKAEAELNAYRKRLEELVEERTIELEKSNEALRIQLSESKAVGDALRKSEERFRTLIQESSDIISILDDQTRFIFNSPSADDVFGYPPDYLLGKSPFEFIHPDDLTHVKTAYDTVLNRTHSGIPTEFRFRKGDGSWIHLEALGQNLFDYPGINGIVITSRDVTERKRTEGKLLESEQRFKEIADLLPEAVFEIDLNLKLTFVNERAKRFFGYEDQEAQQGLYCLDMIIPEERERAIRNFKARLGGMLMGPIEYTALKKDGTTFPALISSMIVMQNGKPHGFRGILIDLTETKKAEENIRTSEQMIRSILSTTPVGIGLTVDRKIKWVNEAWRQIFGFENDQSCMDQSISILYSSEQNYEESRRRIYTILKNDKIASIESCMVRQNGSLFPAQINVAPLDPSDLKKGAISTITDISEWKRLEQSLRESEERYRLALEATSDGLWDWNITTGFVSYSPAWYRILGETFPHHFSSWESRMHPDEKNSILISLKDHLDGNNDAWHLEHRLRTANGKWKWVLGRGSVIARDENKKPLRMVGTIIDIDERKLLQTQLGQAQKMEAIGTLAGGIAHDFNNILGSISGYTELSLLKNRSQNSREKDLHNVLKACERAKNLVNQILLFSRQREGEKKSIDVTVIVKEALKLLRASLPSTIKINSHWSPEPLWVVADPTHIHQIIMNLCTNAAHAMRNNGGVLDVSISGFLASGKTHLMNSGFKSGPYVHLKVSDTGHGIEPSILDKIFDPFFTTKEQGEGTGLGLAVVYGIIKNYDGIINVESKIGGGSTFDIYFPCVDAKSQSTEKEPENIPLKGSEHVLIVDDEKDLVVVMSQFLDSMGYEVTTSTSSSEALKIFRDEPLSFDLVITDMTMPQMTGLKLSREIHAARPGIPIILSTGYDIAISKTEAKENGIREFVQKPIRFNEFSVLIRNVLDKPSP